VTYGNVTVANTTPLTFNHSGSSTANFGGSVTLNSGLTIHTTASNVTPGAAGTNFMGNISGAGGIALTPGSTGRVDFSQTNRIFSGGLLIEGGEVYANVAGTDLVIGNGDSSTTGTRFFGTDNITIDGGALTIEAADDHVAVTEGAPLTLNSGTLNIVTAAPLTGNDFRLDYGQYVQTGGTANFNLGDDFNLYSDDNTAAGTALISGGVFNVELRDQFRTYSDDGPGPAPLLSITNGTDANIILNRVRDADELSQEAVALANYQNSDFYFANCGTTITVTETNSNAPAIVNLAGSTSILDGAVFESAVPTVLNRTLTLTGDNSANMTCPTGPGELRMINSGNLYVNGTPTMTAAPNLAFDSASNQSIYSVTNAAAPTTSGSTNYGNLAGSIGGNGTISGAGTIRKDGAGTLTLHSSMGAGSIGANRILIEGGTLMLGANNQITNTTNLELDGGTFNTNTFDSSMGSLTLSSSSTIDLGAGTGSIVNFSGATYTGGTFTVSNWSGSFDGGGADQILFGTTVNQALLNNVFWSDLGLYGAKQLHSGEIVPVPEPSTYAIGAILNGAIGWWEVRRRKALKSDKVS